MAQPNKHDSQMADSAGNPLIAKTQSAAIAALVVTGTYATDDTPIETAINDIISVLEANGFIADN